MADKLWRCIGRAGDLQASTRVTDENVARFEYVKHSIEAASHCGLLVDSFAVAWNVDCECAMAQLLEFGDCPCPAPSAMETTVNQNEAHVV
jgi:hypothetical protein